MNSRYDVVFEDPYSYRGSNCLKNKLGLRDTTLLQAFELEVSSVRAEEPLPTGKFGPFHYRNVHRHLFQDVYRWAGRYRSISTSKGGHLFCRPQFIERQMNDLFRRLGAPTFLAGVDRHGFTAAAAEFLAELNAIHPFREGNGRSQLAFLHLLAIRAGHPLRLELLRRDTFLPAMIDSFDGELQPLTLQLQAVLT